jgi:hypothetical protein
LPLREPIDGLWYRGLQLAGAAGSLAWCLWQQRRGSSARWLATAALGAGLAWLMLFGPSVEHATYVFLTPVLAWAWLERNVWPRGRALITAAVVLIFLLGWGIVGRSLAPWTPLAEAALPLGTSLFALWLIGAAWSDRNNVDGSLRSLNGVVR